MAVVDVVAMNRASAVLARLAAVGAGALVVTGVPLLFLYEPDGGARWLGTAHGLASMLFLGATAGLLLAALAAAWARDRTWATWPLALGAFVVAGAGAITGQLIGWDQVVPDGATAADDGARGMFDAVAGDVRVVVVGGAEVDPGVLVRWTLVHVVVVSAVAVILGRLLWLRLQAWTAAEEEDGNQTVER
jgi:hypothetical protein